MSELLQLHLCVLHGVSTFVGTFSGLEQSIRNQCSVRKRRDCSQRSILHVPPMGFWAKCWSVWLHGVPPHSNMDVSPGNILTKGVICWGKRLKFGGIEDVLNFIQSLYLTSFAE